MSLRALSMTAGVLFSRLLPINFGSDESFQRNMSACRIAVKLHKGPFM